MKPRVVFFEKINKTDKLLARFTKKEKEKTQINQIRNEKREITDTTHIPPKKKNHKRLLQ